MDVTTPAERTIEPAIEPLSTATSWELWVDRLFTWISYALLAASLLFAQFESITLDGRVRNYGLAVAAAFWTWLTFSRVAPPTRVPQAMLRLYLIGFLVLVTLLVVSQPIFLIYGCAGFFHAALLRPWPLVFIGIGAFAFVVHAHIILNEPTNEHWGIYLGVVAIQTVTTGLGLYAGEKITEIADERRVALQRLETALEENAGLHAQLVVQAKEAGVLEERERLAGEIHDTIAQDLAGIVTQLEAAEQSWGDDTEVRHRFGTAAQLAREGLAGVRRSVRALEPAQLEGARLPSALEDVARKWSDMTGVATEVRLTGSRRRLDTETEVVLLRATQEALANVEQHAAATRARITLSFAHDSILLDVRDDGRGFRPADGAGADSFGLTAMRRRVEHLGGILHVESSPGEGAAVSIRIPTVPEPRVPDDG